MSIPNDEPIQAHYCCISKLCVTLISGQPAAHYARHDRVSVCAHESSPAQYYKGSRECSVHHHRTSFIKNLHQNGQCFAWTNFGVGFRLWVNICLMGFLFFGHHHSQFMERISVILIRSTTYLRPTMLCVWLTLYGFARAIEWRTKDHMGATLR